MPTMMDAIRARLGPPPRWSPELAPLVRLPRPNWIGEGSGPLLHLFRDTRSLLENGTVCWAYLVIANTLLFQPGDSDHPALVVYSHDPFVDRFPHFLAEPASRLGHYHSTDAPGPVSPLLRDSYLRIRDEVAYPAGLPVPPVLSGGRHLLTIATLVFREHLPLGYLTGRLFPLLVQREDLPPAAMPLPGRLWPESLYQSWVRAGTPS